MIKLYENEKMIQNYLEEYTEWLRAAIDVYDHKNPEKGGKK